MTDTANIEKMIRDMQWFIHRLAHVLRINGCKTEWIGVDRDELWCVCASCGKHHFQLSSLQKAIERAGE